MEPGLTAWLAKTDLPGWAAVLIAVLAIAIKPTIDYLNARASARAATRAAAAQVESAEVQADAEAGAAVVNLAQGTMQTQAELIQEFKQQLSRLEDRLQRRIDELEREVDQLREDRRQLRSVAGRLRSERDEARAERDAERGRTRELTDALKACEHGPSCPVREILARPLRPVVVPDLLEVVP
ncbi:MAG TPA: hypothetical protein VHN99_05495 [Deinococcales bacterium]|nr:hypothetical protein [Deinococcales bacterium]